jgi:hypothetical protein
LSVLFGPEEIEGMTDAQLYLLVSSFVVFLVGMGGAYYWIRKSDREQRDAG